MEVTERTSDSRQAWLAERLPRLKQFIEAWGEAMKEALQEDIFQYDPEFTERIVGLMEIYGRYFDSEVRGVDRFPESGPMIVAGNHSGLNSEPDTPAVMAAWYRKRGFEYPLTVLSFDPIFAIPKVKDFFRRLGQVPASAANAEAALASGASVLVYPGGGYEIARPWTERNQVCLAGRKGFIKLALRTGAPVVPVVGHGGHNTSIVLTRGEGIAKALGLNKLRFDVMPLAFVLPWGVVLGPIPALIPLPAKVTVQVCEPLDWSHLGPEDADNPDVLEQCYREVETLMQQTLDALVAENPFPLAQRMWKLLRKRKG
jgi:1-acyl-sn-glycerol-3-phosphate acyltransferase